MKFSIERNDFDALNAKKKNWRREVARVTTASDAAQIALAFGKASPGANLGFNIVVRGKGTIGSDKKDLGTVYCNSAPNWREAEFTDQVVGNWKRYTADQAKWKRIFAFLDIYTPSIHVDYGEWKRVGGILRKDQIFWTALVAEDYAAAALRAEALGIPEIVTAEKVEVAA